MRDKARRDAARRRWYYRNRTSQKELRARVLDVPMLSAAERLAINLAIIAFAREGKRRKSEELQRKREERQCVICGGQVLVKNLNAKSCSKECAKIARRKRDNWDKSCEFCGSQCRGQNKFCDACIALKNHLRVRSIEEAKTSTCAKRMLLAKRGHRCEGCGLTEWLGSLIPLELHHVDGDSDNNKEVNLQLLCPNCHAFTPTFKSRNRMATEKRRRVRKTREFASVAQVAEPLICNQQVGFSSNPGCSSLEA